MKLTNLLTNCLTTRLLKRLLTFSTCKYPTWLHHFFFASKLQLQTTATKIGTIKTRSSNRSSTWSRIFISSSVFGRTAVISTAWIHLDLATSYLQSLYRVNTPWDTPIGRESKTRSFQSTIEPSQIESQLLN